eukprot:scaffold86858_cov28-Tisochrysis_lutea.AAC.1
MEDAQSKIVMLTGASLITPLSYLFLQACAASQKGLTVAMQPQHSDTRVLDNKQKPVDGSPPEHKAGLRPRAASAARARPSPSDVPPAWPHKQSGAASWAGVQPAHPSGT